MAVMTQNRTSQITEDQSVVDRLSIEKIEKTVLLHTVQQEGFELGIRSSSKLSDQDFRHFDRVRTIAADLDGDALDYLWTFLDFKGYPQQARFHHPELAQLLEVDAQSRIAFVQSWVEGVLSVGDMENGEWRIKY